MLYPRSIGALALAAAVLMIEPTLANPRSEIIELLIGTLGVDPLRVIELARVMTESIASSAGAATAAVAPSRGRGLAP